MSAKYYFIASTKNHKETSLYNYLLYLLFISKFLFLVNSILSSKIQNEYHFCIKGLELICYFYSQNGFLHVGRK